MDKKFIEENQVKLEKAFRGELRELLRRYEAELSSDAGISVWMAGRDVGFGHEFSLGHWVHERTL